MQNEMIITNNGNSVLVHSQRIAYGYCILDYTIYDKNGNWSDSQTDKYTLGYYTSTKDFILSNCD